jgi:glycosyltransferase involved in cell wall biosynthesis
MPLPRIEIVIPVYNEGPNIRSVLESFRRDVKTPYSVLICYDHEKDTTLEALAALSSDDYHYSLVRNHGRGVLDAIRAGFQRTTAPYVFTFPADDDYNASRFDAMIERAVAGCDIVCASRFMHGGCMIGCWWVKAVLVRSAGALLYHIGRLPTHDPTNGFRLFSRRMIDVIPIESEFGWAFSLELLVKCHRLGWRIEEIPAEWHERKVGKSRFRTFGLMPQYLRWLFFALATTWLRRPSSTVPLRSEPGGLAPTL